MQSSNPIRSVPFKAQVCAMDANDRFAVVCTADRQAHIFELASMQSRQVETGLNWPARVVSFFPSSVNCDLFAIGSIEGRVRIQAVMEGAKTPNESRIMRDANFSYKCHRHAHLAPVKAPGKSDSQHVFPVNALAHHPNGTYCTGGGDGSLTFWDGLGRSKNKTYSTTDLGNGDPLKAATGTPCMPIVSAAYNNTGDILAYAFSYDWAKGHDGVPAGAKAARIMLHAITAEEKKSKVKI
jgi:mRNA export factor